jgi:lipoyl(octanoyl) transferase
MLIRDLGILPYRDAWTLQERIHADVVAGAEEQLLLVEHPPVITLGRRPGLSRNIIASPHELALRGVETIESDRGGDVTFHGPGQLVAYPIVRLNDHKLSVGGYVRKLQEIVIQTLNDLGVPSQTDPDAIGVWTCPSAPAPAPDLATERSSVGLTSSSTKNPACELAKICAIGVRIRRGVSMHGIALNVATDLSYFNLIVPCGLVGRPVTSIRQLLAEKTPSMPQVKAVLADRMRCAFAPCQTSSIEATIPP